MQMVVKQLLACGLALIVTINGASSQVCDYPPCSSVPDRLTYYYPNWDDCSSYWRCFNNVATRLTCPAGQVFDFYTFTCRTRPTQLSLRTDPVFSCELLLNGLDSLGQPQSS